jgi:hypothetical protein
VTAGDREEEGQRNHGEQNVRDQKDAQPLADDAPQ